MLAIALSTSPNRSSFPSYRAYSGLRRALVDSFKECAHRAPERPLRGIPSKPLKDKGLCSFSESRAPLDKFCSLERRAGANEEPLAGALGKSRERPTGENLEKVTTS